MRIGDPEREQVIAVLRDHCADGRLTLDEFGDRVTEVLNARTAGELAVVTRQLPVPAPLPAGQVEPQRVGQSRAVTRWAVAILGGHSMKGRWRVREDMKAIAFMGGCDIDLRHAELEGPEVTITAIAIMGGIDVIVPEGIEVEMTGHALMGGRDCRIADVPRLPGSPLVRVRAYALMGGVSVRSKKNLPPEERSRRDRDRDRYRQRAERMQERARDRAERYDRHVHNHVERAVAAGASAREAMAMPEAPDGTVTILFSDIEGYTAMTERLGDLKAQEVLHRHNEIIRDHIDECDGYEVKSQGDGFMIAFAGAGKAVRCAIGIQRAMMKDAAEHPDSPIRVRIGLHTGEAIKEADDFLGSTVILAARISDQAAGGEILVSSLLKELTNGSGEFQFGEMREVELKGLTGARSVYPVNWN